MEQKDAKNITKMAIPILLTLSMHIRLTRLLQVNFSNAKYDLKKKLGKSYTDAD